MTPPTSSDALPDPVLPQGRYVRVREIGHGGMSVVYQARDTRQGRHVAMKICRLDSAGPHSPMDELRLARFRREATFAGLVHPNIIRVYDSGIWEENGAVGFALVQELVQGQPLDEALREQRLPGRDDRRASRVRLLADFLRACEGMAYAHEAGVIHRDLKPGNILLVPDYTRARVLDFGLAKWLGRGEADERGTACGGDADQSMDGQAVGTPSYMSPEQAAGALSLMDVRSDVWSLGIVLFEILTYSVPVRDTSAQAILDRVAREEAPSPTEFLARLPAAKRLAEPVPPSLEAIVGRCLRRDPAERYPDARGLLADLDRYLHSPQGVLELFPASNRRRFAPGEIVALEGEPSRAMYVLERGRGTVVIEKAGWKRLCTEGFFGEAALVRPGQPRTATLRAGEEGCELIEVPDEDGLLRLLHECPLIGVQAIRELHSRRVEAEEYYVGRITDLERGRGEPGG